MKEYYRILEIFNSIMSKKVRYNAYVKILVNTQDDKLKTLIQNRLDNPATKAELIEYCNFVINSKIPTWQIIASRHGWEPKEEGR